MLERPFLLAETTWNTVKKTPYEVAILPWGATEAHNYHLPYATDNIQCDYIAAEAAKLAWNAGAKVVVLPTIPFGVNTGQFDIKLDINMYPSTQTAVLCDIVESMSRQQIPKLVVLNGHGGNNFKQIIREVRAKVPGVLICMIDWFRVIPRDGFFEEEGDHADEMETSVMMHIAPELVRPLSEAGDGAVRAVNLRGVREGWAWTERQWSRVTKDTGTGNPRLANADKGKRYLDAVTHKISNFLIELADIDPTDIYA